MKTAGILLLAVLAGSVFGRVSAQSTQPAQEVSPYKIADIPSDGVYKLVHHGCAIYVARERVFQINHGDTVTVAIATGDATVMQRLLCRYSGY